MHMEMLEKSEMSSYHETDMHLHFTYSDFNPFSD